MGIGGMLEEFIKILIDEATMKELFYSGVNSFLAPALLILCAVGAIKIGWSFLSRAFR